MKTTHKFSGTINGIKVKNIPFIKYSNGSDNYYPTGMSAVTSVIKQYLKGKYGLKVQTYSQTFSMGDSVTIYFDPRTLTRETFKEIEKEMVSLFQTHKSSYCGDYADYKRTEGTYINELGKEVNIDTKYISCNYEPNWDTKLREEWEAEGRPVMVDPSTAETFIDEAEELPTIEEVKEVLNTKEEIKPTRATGERAPVQAETPTNFNADTAEVFHSLVNLCCEAALELLLEPSEYTPNQLRDKAKNILKKLNYSVSLSYVCRQIEYSIREGIKIIDSND